MKNSQKNAKTLVLILKVIHGEKVIENKEEPDMEIVNLSESFEELSVSSINNEKAGKTPATSRNAAISARKKLEKLLEKENLDTEKGIEEKRKKIAPRVVKTGKNMDLNLHKQYSMKIQHANRKELFKIHDKVNNPNKKTVHGSSDGMLVYVDLKLECLKALRKIL